MYDSGVVAGQNGEIWSRGLPASWVMVVLATSTVAARSDMTRYGVIGTSSERSFVAQSASHSARMPGDPRGDRRGTLGAWLPDRSAAPSISASQDQAPRRRRSPTSTGTTWSRSAGVGGGVDVPLACRPLEAVAGLREAAADAEDEVRLAHEHVQRPRHRPAARAERQRMVLGEGALALEARGDRRAEQLGQRPQLGPGLGVVDALAGVEDRPLGGDEDVGGAFDRRPDRARTGPRSAGT